MIGWSNTAVQMLGPQYTEITTCVLSVGFVSAVFVTEKKCTMFTHGVIENLIGVKTTRTFSVCVKSVTLCRFRLPVQKSYLGI